MCPFGDGQSVPDFFHQTDEVSPTFWGRFSVFKMPILDMKKKFSVKAVISTISMRRAAGPEPPGRNCRAGAAGPEPPQEHKKCYIFKS
jgi:hypothetical protein